MNEIKIIFFGTSHFAVPILQSLINASFKPEMIVTQPDSLVGRHKVLVAPPVKTLGINEGIECYQPENLKTIETEQKIWGLQPDICILAAYGNIIPKNILVIPKLGFLNIHPSLLPLFRGPSPIQTSIIDGVSETGTSIMLMDEKIDHGQIIAQKKINIEPTDNFEDLQIKLTNLSAELLVNILPEFIAGKLKASEQNHIQATFTKLIKSADGLINWTKPASDIERQIRAYHLWPKAHTFWDRNDKKKPVRINIMQAVIEKSEQQFESGIVINHNNSFAITTSQDLLIPQKLQIEGKKETTAEEFFRGYKNIIGAKLK